MSHARLARDLGLGTRNFEVIPAIDLRGGHCVRLFQGDYGRETRYSDDPAAMALRWQELGAPRLHVVDLDGARAGRPLQAPLVAAIVAAVSIPVEVSGGLRTIADIDAAFAYGADRVQLGSAAVHHADVVREAIARYPGAICISVDSRDGFVATDGWLGRSELPAIEFAAAMVELGAPRIMATDIGRDSTLSGPNLELLATLVAALPVPVVASGGVATLDHLAKLANLGCEGAIVGKALYEGAIELPAALRAAGADGC
jgi:phosphoribosylformimino-5-aminoimidazole carboxamide ribotide isomerase